MVASLVYYSYIFLAVVYRRRASDFFMEVIRFSSIKLWIRYQIWTCFLYGLILIMVKVLVIQFMLQLPNWDIGVLFIVDFLNACVLVLFCFMLYALGANVQMNFACVSFFFTHDCVWWSICRKSN